MKQFFKQHLGAVLGIMISMLALTACKQIPNETDDGDNEQIKTVAMKRTDNTRLVALAVCKLFDGKTKTFIETPATKVYSAGADTKFDKSNRRRYYFDAVKIVNAVRYITPKVDFPFINEVCGKDETEVFLALSQIYKYVDKGTHTELEDCGGESVIVFRGKAGVYCCLNNSGSPNHTVYSSHKRFRKNSREKDFTPPVFEFHIKTENGEIALACSTIIDENGRYSPQETLNWTPLHEKDSNPGGETIVFEDLTNVPEIERRCTVKIVGEDCFEVESDADLRLVYFDEYTEFFDGDNAASSSTVSHGDEIIVTYDDLYREYNPKITIANKITKR